MQLVQIVLYFHLVFMSTVENMCFVSQFIYALHVFSHFKNEPIPLNTFPNSGSSQAIMNLIDCNFLSCPHFIQSVYFPINLSLMLISGLGGKL